MHLYEFALRDFMNIEAHCRPESLVVLHDCLPVDSYMARRALHDAYDGEPFVRVLPEGEIPTIQAVRGTNYCDVALFPDARNDTWILLSTLDNLGKGASGQAVQCANLVCGFPETMGLLDTALLP